MGLNFSWLKDADFAGNKEKSEPFGSDLVVDDTRLEFRGQSVKPCKSVQICVFLYVFESY